MRGELVALDLETTGLNSQEDAIIEFGAVRLLDGRIIDEYSTMINPGKSIPASITHLTGIRPEDVVGAPLLEIVLPEISTFVGASPIIAHNISFDMGFLQRHKILKANVQIDTYDLASVLLPRAPRYNLNNLTQLAGIQLEHAHRALDDARATALLYWFLWERVLELPVETLNEIINAAQSFEWTALPTLEAALKEATLTTTTRDEAYSIPAIVFEPAVLDQPPRQPREHIEPLDPSLVTGLFEEDGKLAKLLPGYEHRPQQSEMVRAIVTAFNEGRHLIVEAGTGIGKSIAYLVPSILWAIQNGERVVVSTNTINLQDQLINKDIPAIVGAIDTAFTVAVIKGRSNYLCPRRLDAIRRHRPNNIDELRTLAKILVWLLESKTGDRSEISLRGPLENSTWQRLSAADEDCALHRCQTRMNGACPFYKARRSAEMAHLLILNHALLISDATTENHVLPDFNYLIVDEVHQLEEAITKGLDSRIDQMTIIRRMEEIGSAQAGLLGDVLKAARNRIPNQELAQLETFISNIADATTLMTKATAALFKAVANFLVDIRAYHPSEYATQIRVTDIQRAKTAFSYIVNSWQTLKEFFEVIGNSLSHLTTALSRMQEYDIPGHHDLVNSIGAAARFLEEIHNRLATFVTAPDPNIIYWINVGQNHSSLSLHTAPLHVGPLVEQYIWNANRSVIMTSATIQTQGSFDYFRNRLFAEDILTLELGSPFNYRDSTLVYIPDDIPDPGDRHGYQQAVERGLVELAAALEGRVLGLFTSYAQLRQTVQAIAPRMALGNITIFDQSGGTSREALLDGFKSTERAVLLATRSFWEGVDIPGESLSALVIVRLPFTPPSNPVFSARAATYNNSFNNYAVPDAILRFRQGFGRLIRSQTDRGIVAILDSRVLTKGYGSSFLEALPDCTVQYGPLSNMAQAANSWLDQHKD